MNRTIRIVIVSVAFLLGLAAQSHAQFLSQSLNVTLTAYDTLGHRTVRIGTKELIRYLVGTNVANAHLDLVTPVGNEPGTIGNLSAFLRIRSGSETVLEITSPDQFNLYQDVAALKTSGGNISSHAINRFSIDNGGVRGEIQGFSTWSFHSDATSGAGSFHSSVNGWIWISELGEEMVPIRGSIVAGRPHPES